MTIKFSKSIFKSVFIFSLFLVCCAGIKAQAIDSSLFFDPITDDIRNRIPPLEALIDSAIANSPQITIEELKAAAVKYEIISARREWTKYFEIIGYSNAGLWLRHERNELSGLSDFYLTESRRQAFNAGFTIKLPLYNLIDRKNNINKEKKKLEIAIVQREVIVKEIRKIVIATYNELIQLQDRMKISNDYQQTSDMMMQNAEIMFLNGEIPPEEFNRQKDYQTRGALEYAANIGNFNNAYTLLEELVGFRFNLINVLK